MIKLEIHNHKTFVKEFSKLEEYEFIQEKLKFFIRNFMPIEGKQYTVENIFQAKESSFPSAYTNILIKEFKKKNFKYELTDKKSFAAPYLYYSPQELPPMFSTQAEALEAISKNNIGIVAKATGSGKTRVILETVMLRKVKTLILVPTEDIKMNTVDFFNSILGEGRVSSSAPSINDEYEIKRLEKILKKESESVHEDAEQAPKSKDPLAKLATLFSSSKDYGQPKNKLKDKMSKLYSQDSFKDNDLESPEAKFLKESPTSSKAERKGAKNQEKELRKLIRKFDNKSADITIICYQALGNVSERFLNSIEMLIIDEAHTASVSMIRAAALKMPKAGYRYFFTATPWRDLAPQMHLLLSVIGDDIIYELKGKTAAEKKIISTPHLNLIESPKPNVYLDPKKLNKNPRQRKVLGIIANESRNAFIVDTCIKLFKEGHNVFIAVDEIAHSDILQQRFEHQKIEVNIINGELPSPVKRERVKKAGAADSMITIGTMAVGIGTDMPKVDVVFLASGGKSSIRFLQRIGRGSRKTKPDFYIYDLWDWFNDRLLAHSKERFKIYKEEFEEFSDLENRFKLFS